MYTEYYIEYYNTACVEIVEDYILHFNRDRMMTRCQELAEDCGVDFTEVVGDVDLLYTNEYGDLYEIA